MVYVSDMCLLLCLDLKLGLKHYTSTFSSANPFKSPPTHFGLVCAQVSMRSFGVTLIFMCGEGIWDLLMSSRG